MNYLLKPVLRNLMKQKTTWLLFAISVFPLIIIVASFFDTNFMQLEGMNASISGMEFVAAIVFTQHQFIFPFIILAFIASTLFFDEIKSGRLIMFKDNPRKLILNAKRFSTIIVFTLYFLLISLSSLVTYFIYIKNLPIATGTLLPLENSEVTRILIEILGYFLTELVGLSLALTVSIFLTSGYTILVTIFYQLLSMLAPNLATLKYLFPSGYSNLHATFPAVSIVLGMLVVTITSVVFSKCIASYLFKKIEY